MQEPWFWRDKSLAARAAALMLTPAALIYDVGRRARAAMATPNVVAAPVVCVGNATLGGVGKTPFALMLHALLKARRLDAHFQSRGYGGSLKGPVRVNNLHTAQDVGDEALLLAAAGPTFVAKSRAEGVRAAADAGASAIVMDDGFQNPSVRKDFSILLLDASDIAGNGRTFPAGPLREPLSGAVGRADAIVFAGFGKPTLQTDKPIFRARSHIEPTIGAQPVVAFCGIGRPTRFFASLESAGFTLAGKRAFPDHHVYQPAELSALRATAAKAGAPLITTEKDFVRLDAASREDLAVAKLIMTVDDPERLTALVLEKIGRTP